VGVKRIPRLVEGSLPVIGCGVRKLGFACKSASSPPRVRIYAPHTRRPGGSRRGAQAFREADLAAISAERGVSLSWQKTTSARREADGRWRRRRKLGRDGAVSHALNPKVAASRMLVYSVSSGGGACACSIRPGEASPRRGSSPSRFSPARRLGCPAAGMLLSAWPLLTGHVTTAAGLPGRLVVRGAAKEVTCICGESTAC
jgi:hypothetical protein